MHTYGGSPLFTPLWRWLPLCLASLTAHASTWDDIAALETSIGALEAQMAACGSDYVKLQELQARQAELEAALEEKTERWVYLNELKEQIDAQNG